MTTASPLPALSELLSWETDHFFQIATHLGSVADEWENSYVTIGNDAHLLDWAGASADAARARITSDKHQVADGAEKLRAGAHAARAGVPDVRAAQNRLRYAVEDALATGFGVGDDYSVYDTQPGIDPARWAQAERHATAVYDCAAHLVDVNTSVGDRAKAAVTEVASLFHFLEADEATLTRSTGSHTGSGVQPEGHRARPPKSPQPPRAPEAPHGDLVGADGGAAQGPLVEAPTLAGFSDSREPAFAPDRLNTGIGHVGDFLNKSSATAAEYAAIPRDAPGLGPTQRQLNHAARRGAQTWRTVGGVGKNLGRLGYGMDAANGIMEFRDAVKHGSSVTDAAVDVVPKTVGGTAGAYAGAVAGAEYGAGIGAVAGTVVPGLGTAAGAAVGAGVGALAGGVAGGQVGKIAGEAASKIWHVVVD